jgi:hypothetical protein
MNFEKIYETHNVKYVSPKEKLMKEIRNNVSPAMSGHWYKMIEELIEECCWEYSDNRDRLNDQYVR